MMSTTLSVKTYANVASRKICAFCVKHFTEKYFSGQVLPLKVSD